MWILDIFKRTSTPEELYKKKQDKEFIEVIKSSSFTIHSGGGITRNGLSEYGAWKLLLEGKDPDSYEKVMTKDGDLISWQEWKEKENE